MGTQKEPWNDPVLKQNCTSNLKYRKQHFVRGRSPDLCFIRKSGLLTPGGAMAAVTQTAVLSCRQIQ